MGILHDLVEFLQVVAACPSATYCLKARRLDCRACPARPTLADSQKAAEAVEGEETLQFRDCQATPPGTEPEGIPAKSGGE